MKKQCYTLILPLIFGVGVALAAPQEQSVPSDGNAAAVKQQADPSRQARRLAKRLNLTPEQQNQVLPILANRQQQLTAIHNDNTLAAQDRHSRVQAIRNDSEEKIRALLNDSQKQTYDRMQEEMRERAHERRQPQTGSTPGPGTAN